MSDAVRVLAPSTPPDATKPRALFIVGATQDLNACMAQAQAYKTSYSPTSPDPDACELEQYSGSIVVNP